MRLLRAWDSFWGYLGYLRRNRRQRKAAVAKRRNLRRRHRMDALEQRVVLNADPVAVDDENPVNYGTSYDTADFTPNLTNDTDSDGDALAVRFNADPQQSVNLNPGDSYSWKYTIGDDHGGYGQGTVRQSNTTGTAMPFIYVESAAAREATGTVSVLVRLSQPNWNDPVRVDWQSASGTAMEGADYGAASVAGTYEEVWRDAYEYETWVDTSHYENGDWHDSWVNYPIVHDEDYENVWTEDNWVNEGGYDQIWVSEGHYETQYVAGGYDNVWHDAYSGNFGTLYFARGETEKTLTFSVTYNDGVEADESFPIVLLDAVNATLTAWSDGKATILDDAAPISYDDAYVAYRNNPLIVDAAAGLRRNDFHFEDSYTYDVDTNPLGGTVSIAADGSFVYTSTGEYVGTDSFTYIVTDSQGNSSLGSVTINVVSAAPELAINAGLTVNKGHGATVDGTLLQVADIDTPPEVLTYTIQSSPTYGVLYLNGSPLSAGSVFSQADIDAEYLYYQHDGSETTQDGFSFTVTDDSGNIIGPTTFGIDVTQINGAPFMSSFGSLSVTEWLSAPIGSDLLQANDAEEGSGSITYTIVVPPISGTLYRNGSPLSAGATFTQTDVDTGCLAYQDETTQSGYFTFTLVDSEGAVSEEYTFYISTYPDNASPWMVSTNPLSLAEGSSATIDNMLLSAADDYDTNAGIMYSLLAAPTLGTLYLDGSPLSAGATFTQADIDDGRLSYQAAADGDDFFTFTLTDSSYAVSEECAFSIAIYADHEEEDGENSAPWMDANNELSLEEGASATFDSGLLQANDDSDDAASLTYTLVTAPACGTLYLNDMLLSDGSQFTQADIDAGNLTYQHGWVGGGAFTFTVTDSEEATSQEYTFSITTHEDEEEEQDENDAPWLDVNNGLSLQEGSSATIDNGLLRADDDSDDVASLTYTIVTAPTCGTLYLNGLPLADGSQFTQADVDIGGLAYEDSGSGGGAFTFTVTDSEGAVSGEFTFYISTNVEVEEDENDAPWMEANNGLSLVEGLSATIDNGQLQANDDLDDVTSLTYMIVTPPTCGTLHLDGDPLSGGSTFTQADIDAGRLTYEDSGTGGGTFTFTVIDSEGTISDEYTFSIATYADEEEEGEEEGDESGAPWMDVLNELSLVEGSSAAIDNVLLQANDDSDYVRSLTYTLVTGPACGTLYRNGLSLSDGSQFTQADVDDGGLTYEDGWMGGGTFTFTVTDSEGTVSEEYTFLISTYSDDEENNAPWMAANNELSLVEGAWGTIDDGYLQARDDSDDAPSLTYTLVTAPNCGMLYLNDLPLSDGSTFTQADVDAGNVTYHDGREDGGTFTFSVTDSEGTVSEQFTFYIATHEEEEANSAPGLEYNNELSLVEGSSATIDNGYLYADDDSDDVASLTYMIVTPPACGTLLLNGYPLSGGSTFTQADIDVGNLTYEDGGTGGGLFTFTVTDSEGAVSQVYTFYISTYEDEEVENDAPTIDTNNKLVLVEGTTATISSGLLQAQDVSDGPSSLTYTVNSPSVHGTLLLYNVPLSSGASFTQADIDAGGLTFEAWTSGNVEFTFTVSNSQYAVTNGTFVITVLDATMHMEANEGLTIGEGATLTITSGMLRVRDDGLPTDQLTYFVDMLPTDGILYLNDMPLTSGYPFTQADIDAGLLSFHANTVNSDCFMFTVTDPFARFTDYEAFTILIIDSEPYLITSADMSVETGSTTTITEALLLVGDDDSAPEDLTYTLNMSPAYGILYRNGSQLSMGGTFTQADINDGLISYQADTIGEEQFAFTITDESGHNMLEFPFLVTVTQGNVAPEVVNCTGLTLSEGSVVQIDAKLLLATDETDGPESLKYTLDTPPISGALYLNGTLLVGGDIFTQADVDAGLLTFHAGEPGDTGFYFTVRDSLGSTNGKWFAMAVTPLPRISVSGDSASESSGTLTFTVTLSQESDTPVTVDWSIIDGTAARPEDYGYYYIPGVPAHYEQVAGYSVIKHTPVHVPIYTNLTYQLGVGERIAGYYVTEILDPNDPEATQHVDFYSPGATRDSSWVSYRADLQTIFMTVDAGTYISIGSPDPNWPNGGEPNGQTELQFEDAPDAFIVGEPDSSLHTSYQNDDQPWYTFTPSTNNVLIPEEPGTWEPLGALSGTLTFAPGESLTQTIVVQIRNDNLVELDESLRMQLSNAQGAILAEQCFADGVILNDDQPPPNYAPVAVADSYTTTQDVALTVDAATGLRANDSDPDGDALFYSLVNGPVSGLLLHSDGSFVFTPAAGSTASVSFTYEVSDGHGHTAQAGVTITVAPVNYAPTISSISDQTILEDGLNCSVNFTIGDDITAPDALTLTVSADDFILFPTGSLILSGTGTERTLAIVPASNRYGGPVTISITASDGEQSFVRTFTVTVLSVNDAPSFTLDEDASTAIDSGPFEAESFASAIDVGPEEASQTPTFVVTTDNPDLFTADGQPAISAEGKLTFTPRLAGSATVTVTLRDNGGTDDGGHNSSAAKTFTITVTEPVFGSSGGGSGDTSSGAPINPDVDGDHKRWAIETIRVVIDDEDDDKTFDLAEGHVPHIAIDGVLDIKVDLVDELPEGAKVELVWGADPYGDGPAETVTRPAASTVTFHKDFSDVEDSRLPSETVTVRVKKAGGDVIEERVFHFVLDWPVATVELEGKTKFKADADEEIKLTFDVPEKLQHGLPVVGLKSSLGGIDWPYYPNAAGESDPHFNKETGVYTLSDFPSAPGKYTYVAQYGHAYKEFVVTIEPADADNGKVHISIGDLAISEGDQSHVSVNFDEEVEGTFSISVNWGDGTSTSYDVEDGKASSASHVYRDGTHSYVIKVTVSGTGVNKTQQETVWVYDVPPVLVYNEDNESHSGIPTRVISSESIRGDTGLIVDDTPVYSYTSTVVYEGYIFDPGLDDTITEANRGDRDASIKDLQFENLGEGNWKYTVRAEFDCDQDLTYFVPADVPLPGFWFSDGTYAYETGYFHSCDIAIIGPGDGNGGKRAVSVLGTILDGVAGEPIKLADGTVVDEGAVVRFSRTVDESSISWNQIDYVTVDGIKQYDTQALSLKGTTTITYRLEPISPSAENADWSSVTGTVTIPDGKQFIDLVLKPVDDDKVEWNEKFRLVITGWTNRKPDSTGNVIVGEIAVLDNDAKVSFGSENVDTGATGLTREWVQMLDGGFVSLYDGQSKWVVPFGDGELGTIYSGISSSVVNVVQLPGSPSDDPEGEEEEESEVEPGRKIAFTSGDAATIVVSNDDEQLTLRRNYGGIDDLGGAAAAQFYDANPMMGLDRFGFVDRLVPAETHGAEGTTPLLGFVLMRRDGTSAWYSAKPLGAAAETAEAAKESDGLHWSVDELESDRFYQVTLPFVSDDDNDDKYGNLTDGLRLVKGTWVTRGAASDQSSYGATLGFVVPDADGKIEFVYDGSLKLDARELKLYDRWTFITPEGSLSPTGASLATLTSAGADDTGSTRLSIATKFGDACEFDGLGLLQTERDRLGNRNEFFYETSRRDNNPIAQRLLQVQLQGGLTLDFEYTADEGKSLASIAEYIGSPTDDNPTRQVTLVSGDTLISPTPDDPTRSYAIHATSTNPTNLDATHDVHLQDAYVDNYVSRVFFAGLGEHASAPTGKIGRLKDTSTGAIDEATAGYRRAYYDQSSIEAAPAEWTYQFDRFGLVTAMAAPLGKDDGERSVWQWERDEKSGYVKYYREPAAQGDTADTNITLPDSGFFETKYEYDAKGNLKKVTYADNTTEEWTYDASKNNQLESYTDRNQNVWHYDLYADGSVKVAYDALGNETKYAYLQGTTTIVGRPNGLVDLVTDPLGVKTKYTYFDMSSGRKSGLVQKITYAFDTDQAREETFDYDQNGNLQKHVDVDGVLHLFQYDRLGRLLEERIGGEVTSNGNLQNGILVAKYTYDAAGNLRTKSVPAPTGDKFDVSLYEYDEYNRLIKTTETGTRGTGLIETTYAYYGDGLVREVTDTLDQSTEYLYDQRRQLTELKQTLDGVMSSSGSELSGVQTVSYYHYDAAGNLQSEASGLQNQMTTYTYDRDGRVIRKMLPDPDAGASLPALYVSYAYDSEGNQISESLPRPKNQIASAPTGHNFYDEAGRLIRSEGPAVTATVNGSQTLSATFTAYEYYADGSVKTVREGFAVSPGTSDPEDTGLRDDDVVRTWSTTVYDKLGRIKNTTTGGLGIIEATASVEYLKPSDNPSPPINDTLAVSWEKTTAPPIDGLPCVTWNYYDQNGRLIRTVLPDPDGSGALPITSICYSYNADGTVSEQWQEAGTDTTHRNWTKFNYDAVGRLVNKRDVEGNLGSYQYDALGRMEIERTAGRAQLVYEYDAFDRVTKIERYDADGRRIEGVVAEVFGYDVNGNLINHTDPLGDSTEYQYDGLNRRTFARESDTSFTNDNANQAGTKETEFVYSSTGELQYTLTPGPGTWNSNVDSFGRAGRITVGSSSLIKDSYYEYDPIGNVTKFTDADGNITKYEYDGFNRVRKETITPNGAAAERTWDYDAAGNLTKYKDRDGRVTEYKYDALGRRTDEIARDSTTGPETYHASYKYDEIGNLKSAEDANSKYEYSLYDDRGRAGQVDQTLRAPGFASLTTTLVYSYDDQLTGSERKNSAARTGYTVTARVGSTEYYTNAYQFDAVGREVWAEQDAPDASDKQVEHLDHSSGSGGFTPSDDTVTPFAARYDNVRYYQLEQGSNRADVVLDQYTFYEKEDAGLVRRIDVKTPGVPSIGVSYQYNYDNKDLLREFIERDGTLQSKKYDALGQLDANGDGQSDYTANGNAPGTGAYNRPSQINGVIVNYYNEGTIKTTSGIVPFPNGASFATHAFTWDSRNRLTSDAFTHTASVMGSSSVTSATVDYYYDVFNNVIGKRVSAGTANERVGDVEFYVVDGGQRTLTFKFDSGETTPKLLARSFYSASGQIYAVDASPIVNGVAEGLSTHWLTVDRQGNVRDSYRFGFDADGDVASYSCARFNYEDWGTPKSVVDDGAHQSLYGVDENLLQRWQAGIYDVDLQAYKFGDRWMSTSLGRWMSEDPSGLRFGTNPNQALNNSPFNYNDPTGHVAHAVATTAAGAVIGGVWGGVDAWMSGGDFGDIAAGVGKGALIGGAIGLGVGLVPGAVGTFGSSLVAGGLAVGGVHGVMDTYAGNPQAGFTQYAAGFGMGAVSGALNPYAEFTSFGGALIGGGLEYSAGGRFLGTGFLAGGLVGGIGWNARASVFLAQKAGTKTAYRSAMYGIGTQVGSAAIGAGIGYASGGNANSALFGASLGMMGGNVVQFATSRFGGRGVWAVSVPASEGTSAVNPRLIQRLEAFRAYQARGGTKDLSGWVKATQGNPAYGTGVRSGYADWIRSVESVHGNSSLSARTAYLYRLEDRAGNLLKWGITQDLDARYTQGFLMDKKLIEVARGRRLDMLRMERNLVETQPGPLNLESWAGARLGELP